MAFVLFFLLLGIFEKTAHSIQAAILLHLINMIWPTAYKPAAKIWLGFSNVLGAIMSKVVLTLVFFIVVTPVGAIRGILGYDPLQLKIWKTGSGSVFRVCDRTISADDITKPY